MTWYVGLIVWMLHGSPVHAQAMGAYNGLDLCRDKVAEVVITSGPSNPDLVKHIESGGDLKIVCVRVSGETGPVTTL